MRRETGDGVQAYEGNGEMIDPTEKAVPGLMPDLSFTWRGKMCAFDGCDTPTLGYGKNRNLCHAHAVKCEKRLSDRFPGLSSNEIPLQDRNLSEETKRKRHEALEREADRKAGVMMRDRFGRGWP